MGGAHERISAAAPAGTVDVPSRTDGRTGARNPVRRLRPAVWVLEYCLCDSIAVCKAANLYELRFVSIDQLSFKKIVTLAFRYFIIVEPR